MSLIDSINNELLKWGQKLYISNSECNNRCIYQLSGGEIIRKEIDDLIEIPSEDTPEFKIKASALGLELIVPKSVFPSYQKCDFFNIRERKYDCRDWAFDTIGLPHYTGRESDSYADILLHEDLPELKIDNEPRNGNLVVYSECKGYGLFSVKHWGIVSDISEAVLVKSKFGGGHVYEHPIGLVPEIYKDRIAFFRKVENC